MAPRKRFLLLHAACTSVCHAETKGGQASLEVCKAGLRTALSKADNAFLLLACCRAFMRLYRFFCNGRGCLKDG